MKHLIKILAALFLLSNFTFGQDYDYSNEPGYLDFGSFDQFDESEQVTEVVIEENLLRMVSKLASREDPELKELLSGLKLIRVHTFGLTEADGKPLANRIEKLNKNLMDKKWDRIVRTKDRGEIANIYIKTEADDNIVGLVVMSLDPNGEAAFVNIVGKINLETIGRLSDKFDIPSLDSVHGTR